MIFTQSTIQVKILFGREQYQSSFTGGNLISEIQVYTNPNFSTEYLIVTGSFRNITDFDLTTGINNFSSAGTSQDLYIAKYDQSGNLFL
ncbi:MAG: hypothetical protein IPJ79_13365 [Bacteroidetes bacterium]|nr:hypothetical protein [Bacteroidota bacterium]